MKSLVSSLVAIVLSGWAQLGVEGATEASNPLSAALQLFLASDYALVTSVAEIAEPVRVALFARMHHDPRLANPGEQFNPTDVINPRLPMRRLIVAGRSHSSWFVCYEHGGRGYHRQLVIFAADDHQPRLVFSGRFTAPVSSFTDLKGVVKKGLVPDETDASERYGYY